MRKTVTLVVSSILLSNILTTINIIDAAENQPVSQAKFNSNNKEIKNSKAVSDRTYPYANNLPAWNDNYWHYVTDQNDRLGTTWIKGMAHGKYDQFNIDWSGVIGGKKSFEEAYDTLQKDNWTKDGRIKVFIMYNPRCPYSKSYLPQYQKIALEAKAPVLNCDISKYRTATLAPYFDASNTGVVAPSVLWVTKDGKLKGQSGVHSVKRFAEILQECGYATGRIPEENGYTIEDRYKDEQLSETNRERLSKGLLPLSMYKGVNDVADLRAKEIVTKIEHTRPNGKSYTSALQDAKVSGPNYYGENLAAGPSASDPWGVTKMWMDSPPHRSNILNDKFTHVGIGHYINNDHSTYVFKDHWTQLFLGKCSIDKMALSQKAVSVLKGTPIADLGIQVELNCSAHGKTYMPLIDEMVTGYDPQKEGEQSVTVHYGNLTQQLLINVGENTPTPLKADMIDFNISGSKDTRDKDGEISLPYTGQPQQPKITVENPSGEYTLIEGYSYDIRYENNVNVGKAKVIITGKGNYTGKIEKTFNIVPKNIDKEVDIKGIKQDYEYTGKPITPTVTATLKNGTPLYQNQDFTVEFKDNIGTLIKKTGRPVQLDGTPATITIKGKGNYTYEHNETFNLTMSTRQKAAETLAFAIGPTSAYSSLDDMLNTFKKWKNNEAAGSITDVSQLKPAHKQRFDNYMQTTYEKVIEYSKSLGENKEFDVSGSFADKKIQLAEAAKDPDTKKGYQEMMTESLAPNAAKYINEWIDYVQKERGVSQQVETPKVENDKVQNVSVEGLESMITAENSSAANSNKIQLAVTTPTSTPIIDSEKYDVVDAVPVKLDVKFGNETKQISQPITVTMDIPKEFDTNNEFVALRDSNQTRNSDLEEIPVVVDKEYKKMSFTTTKTGDFVLTQKLPTYEVEQALQPANNPAQSGVSFGEMSNEGPAAISNLKVYRDKDKKIQVDWDAPNLKDGWKLDGYTLNFSQHEDMSEAQHMTISKDKTNATVENLPAGKYYFTVTTNASSDWTNNATRDSLISLLDIPGETTEVFNPTYNITTKSNGNGQLKVDVTKKQKTQTDDKVAQKGDTVKITATPNSGYFTSKISVTDAEGNEVKTTKSGDTYIFTMPAKSITVNAMFGKIEAPIQMKKVNIASMNNGDIILDDSQIIDNKAVVNNTVEFQAVADDGYRVDKVSVKTKIGKSVDVKHTTSDKYSFVMPNEEVTIDVQFVANGKAIKEKVAVKKDKVSLYTSESLTNKQTAHKGDVYDAIRQLTLQGKTYYELARNGKVAGYMLASDLSILAGQKASDKLVTKEKITTWNQLYQTSKRQMIDKDKLVEAHYYYTLPNGKQYASLYAPQKSGNAKWLGYVLKDDLKALSSKVTNDKKVATKEYTLWNDLFYTKKRSTTKKDKLYQARRYYDVNGARYYSLYEVSKDGEKWAGYVNSDALKTLKAISVENKKFTVSSKSSYTLWNDLFYTKKKGSTKQGQVYEARRYYDVNNARYYSLYKTNKQGKDEWCGYVNAKALIELKAKKVDHKVKVVKKDYELWQDLYFSRERDNTSKWYNKYVTVKYVYTLGNHKQYYSLYNGSKWLGYVNVSATK